MTTMTEPHTDEDAPTNGADEKSSAQPGAEHHVVISPPNGWALPRLAELWAYRDLALLLIWRNIVGKYRQSLIGVGWVLIRPIVTTLIFTFIFGSVAKLDSQGAPYAMFCFAALLPWTFFMGSVTGAAASVVGGRGLITKVYFPRLILPVVAVFSIFIDFIVQIGLLALMMIYFQVPPTFKLIVLIPFTLFATVSAFAVGIWFTALNVKFRDIAHGIPFIMQSWMWLTPVVYATSAIPEYLMPIYALNPMVHVIDGFRWGILGLTPPDPVMLTVSAGLMCCVLISGLTYFRKVETTFADII